MYIAYYSGHKEATLHRNRFQKHSDHLIISYSLKNGFSAEEIRSLKCAYLKEKNSQLRPLTKEITLSNFANYSGCVWCSSYWEDFQPEPYYCSARRQIPTWRAPRKIPLKSPWCGCSLPGYITENVFLRTGAYQTRLALSMGRLPIKSSDYFANTEAKFRGELTFPSLQQSE